MKKRSLAFFLCIALLCALWVPLIPAASAADITDSGTCGENLTWTLDSDGVLTISGAGAMNDYSWWNLPPWGTEVKTVMIENGVTNIGEYAFFDCSALTNITIPGSVKYIGFYAVYGCRSLLSITIPEGVTALGPSALSNCGLISVTLPESLTSIGAGAFGSCFDLKNVSIPNAVTSIGSSAFSYCIALTSITIPASVANICVAPFRYCWALTEIRVNENNAAYCNDEYGVLFNKDKTELIEAPENAALEDYTIPQSVTYIKDYAFFCCKALKCFTIPASVANIDERAFLSCDNLKSVVFEGDAPSVGSEAFYTRDELTSEYSIIPGLTLYYIEGKEGWTTPEWNGYPTATWDGVNVPHTHKYQSVVTAPTCTEKGYTTYTCAICEDSYVADEVAALGHDLVTDAGVAVTCTESGLTEGKHCSRCDYKIERQAIAALGHVWDEGKVTTVPTTEKEGVRTFTCTRCETTMTEPIDKLQGTVSFKDVDEKAYFAAAVEWAVAKNITKGTAADTFAPNDTCTRGQIVTFLWRAAGEPTPSGTETPFTDVKQSDYWYNAVLWAVEQGITAGTSATTFSPNEGCTRGQVATFLWRYENKPAPAAKNPFEDVKKGAYYYDAVLWAVEADVTKGTSATTFAPNDTCTRGQIVTFLYRDIA